MQVGRYRLSLLKLWEFVNASHFDRAVTRIIVCVFSHCVCSFISKMLKYLSVARILKKHNARVDNAMFHLHYRMTFIIFVVCSALITAKEYFGNPIECYALKSPIPRNVLNTYCFIMSTYTVTKHNDTSPYVVYPGVGPQKDGDHITYQSYYQWVPVVLFLQGISFYFPRFLWKSFDGGLFSSVLMGLDKMCLDKGSIREKCVTLTSYFSTHLNMHRNWAIRYLN